ncbi:MAG: Holliday junction branch migration protein RuvA [Nannocystis sp.]|nr:Holliday junction branch migration protein RuvA [Nannocystis sp.]
MIGWLSGKVLHRDSRGGSVVLDVGGVGYEVRVSIQTLAAVGEPGSGCSLWIYTHVREDALALFGFSSPAEKELFLLLLDVPKVGPKNAMAVLGGLPLGELARSLASGEHGTLQKIPGIGKKTAEQIVLSLKDKVQALAALYPEAGVAAASPAPVSEDEGIVGEAKMVLEGLGWRAREVDAALAKVSSGDGKAPSIDELVRRALAQLMER